MFVSQWRKSLFKKFLKKDRRFSIDTSHNKYILLRYGNILNIIPFCWRKKTLQKALKTIHNIDIKYGNAYFRILKKFIFWKRKKWQIENSENSEILEILFRVFLFPSFRFCPTAKIENSDINISEKIFRDIRDFRGFRVFDRAK